MSAPTTSELFNQSTPAAPSGDQNVAFVSDGGTPLQQISAYPKRATTSAYGTQLKPTAVAITSTSAPGNFTLAHGLGRTPTAVLIEMTAAGVIWFQSGTRYDATNLYLVASDAGLTGVAQCF